MNFLSLFSGIGGLDLGLERAGMRCVGQVECDEFCRRVLAKHWPDVPQFDDVRAFTKDCISEPIDLIAGGFPCQDVSCANSSGEGLDGKRSGLWSEFIRLIREIRPSFALVENVAALLNRGVDRVLGQLAESGYDAEWECLPAAAFGAEHIRDRAFILAYPESTERGSLRSAGCYLDDPSLRLPEGWEKGTGRLGVGMAQTIWPWPDQPAVDRVAYGIPNRLDRHSALANAVVPQVAEWVGQRILLAAPSPARRQEHQQSPGMKMEVGK